MFVSSKFPIIHGIYVGVVGFVSKARCDTYKCTAMQVQLLNNFIWKGVYCCVFDIWPRSWN